MQLLDALELPQVRDPSHWVYGQLFLAPDAPAVTLARQADAMLAQGLGQTLLQLQQEHPPCFFMRYLESGYHLRLRVHHSERAARLGLRQRLQDAARPMLASGGQLRWLRYEPEIAKYGGPLGNALAERHFADSSAVALWVLRGVGRPRSLMALQLLRASLQAAALDPAQAVTWCKAYYQYWWMVFGGAIDYPLEDEAEFRRQARALLRAVGPLDQAPAADPVEAERCIAHWRHGLTDSLRAAAQLEARGLLRDPIRQRKPSHARFAHPITELSLLPNYLHMLFNRMGVTIRQEMRLAHLLRRVIEGHHGAAARPLFMSLIPN